MKAGPDQKAIDNLKRVRPFFCEIWYNADKPEMYADIFAETHRLGIETNLHFWGSIPDGTMVNLSYPDNDIRTQSKIRIKQTIDIAAINKSHYVNIHPGSRAHMRMNLTDMSFQVLTKPADTNASNHVLVESLSELGKYAASRYVALTIETVPPYNTIDNEASRTPANRIPIYQPDSQSVLQAVLDSKTALANDFGHTAAQIISDDRQKVWRNLLTFTEKAAPVTQLIHMGFLVPPFNGTDYHNTLENPVFTSGQALPNYSETIQLLKFFKNRSDVRILVEPDGDHLTNYYAAKKLLKNAGVYEERIPSK